ncbi:MAG: rhodanese-like domain-containing protein [Elusimicrobia bacterium]|nr:rhodanese-like domain-containing protein [Elusimicrobiota bacterium]
MRSIAEYQTAHIEGAVSRPLDSISTASWPKTADIVLYCSGKG